MFFLFPDDDLRVSDADRDAAVDFLNRHYAAGRMTEEEHAARVDAAYGASYDSQLEALTRDLPALPPAHPVRRAAMVPALGRAAAIGVAGLAVVAVASVVPPDAWVMLLGLGLPLLLVLAFTVAPIAIPVLAFAWLARALTTPARRELPREAGGWSGSVRTARRPR